MDNLFKFLPEIDANLYREYFLSEFFDETDFYRHMVGRSYFQFHSSEMQKPMIKKLNEQLRDLFNFPEFEYAVLFKHLRTQPIHVDGHANIIRCSSLNLPLTGYEGTKMIFYKSNIPTRDIIATDAFYFPQDTVEFYAELPGTNNWVLVNSSVPHSIVNSDITNPRMTMCFRFKNNPTYESLSKLVNTDQITY